MKRVLWIGASILAFVLITAAAVASQFNLSALPEPGKTETLLATKAKRFFVERAGRSPLPAEPSDRPSSIQQGDKLFGTDCSECHGFTGRKPTDAGRWMAGGGYRF